MEQLRDYQRLAVNNLKNGSILCGGVGSGKSRTAIAYFLKKEYPKGIRKLYIITTARKRDTLEWERELLAFNIIKAKERSKYPIDVVIDSWNNIIKYVDAKDAFFIFDEQRLVGSGSWVKAFLKIAKHNRWILLSATPGDVWMDYVPVFIANGFYKNRTQFINRHVVYDRFSKYPKVRKYLETDILEEYRKKILVTMEDMRDTIQHHEWLKVIFDSKEYDVVIKQRWNIYEDCPIKNASELCYVSRKVVNSHPDRLRAIEEIIGTHRKAIVFYNFDYELELLRSFAEMIKIEYAEWNGHKHQCIPKNSEWLYFVQYTAGAEGWNCIDTDTIIFYSQNYSYKIMEQSAGRIDRINTPFKDLYYYHLVSDASIDKAIRNCLHRKKQFNEKSFALEPRGKNIFYNREEE
jgi:hypothetical protein